MEKITKPEILQALKELNKVKLEASKNDEYGFDEEWNFFIAIMQFLSPKSFGSRIENRIKSKNGFNKVLANEEKGDFKTEAGQHFELKVSILTVSNNKANFVNIRDWQKTDYYFVVVDARKDNPESYETLVFKLRNEEMIIELEAIGAGSANGTKEANKGNSKVPKRFSLEISEKSEHFVRWKKNYLTADLKY